MLKCVEPCASFEIYRNAKAKRLELQPRLRKCLHYYHYWLHPKLGLMHARIQTWFPFTIQICLNGREWLARRLDVMRFLGCKGLTTDAIHGNFEGQVVSDLKVRPEGVRIKHPVNGNSIKMYDKQGSVLRVEATINEPKDFKVYRPKEGGPADDLAWRTMRRGVADLQRRAKVSQAANERYLNALAKVDTEKPLRELTDGLCCPVKWKGKRARALHPWGQDAAWLKVIGRGEFTLNGFRNRDLRHHLFVCAPSSPEATRRQSGQVTRRLRLFRAHGLIKKVPHTHRFQLTEEGRAVVVALNAARNASPRQMTELAA